MKLELAKKLKNKQFQEDLQKAIDEMFLYERICVEVCIVAIMGGLLAFDFFHNGIEYFILICDSVIFLTFLGAACGFYFKRKKYEAEKLKYLDYIKDKDEIEIQ